jgi:hypothetical protein
LEELLLPRLSLDNSTSFTFAPITGSSNYCSKFRTVKTTKTTILLRLSTLSQQRLKKKRKLVRLKTLLVITKNLSQRKLTGKTPFNCQFTPPS